MRSLNIFQLTTIWASFGLLTLICIRILNPISANPKAWHPPANMGKTGVWENNLALNKLKTDMSFLPRHDTVVADSLGRRYAGVNDGRIVRWQEGGELETYTQLTGRPAGMAIDAHNNLFIVEEKTGSLWKVLPNKATVQLPLPSDGSSLKYLNDVAALDDGRVYATQSSKRWSLRDTSRAVMEHNNDGAVYMWVGSRRPHKVADGLSFPNGITIAHDKQSVLVAETTEYRISRIWLQGKRRGQTEVVLENLPGFPSDITHAADGKHYWGTLFDYRDNIPLVDKLAKYPWARRILLNMPSTWFPKNKGTPAVFLFDGKGHIKQTFQAPENTELPGFSSVVQSDNELILTTANPLDHDDDRVFTLNLNSVGVTLPILKKPVLDTHQQLYNNTATAMLEQPIQHDFLGIN